MSQHKDMQEHIYHHSLPVFYFVTFVLIALIMWKFILGAMESIVAIISSEYSKFGSPLFSLFIIPIFLFLPKLIYRPVVFADVHKKLDDFFPD